MTPKEILQVILDAKLKKYKELNTAVRLSIGLRHFGFLFELMTAEAQEIGALRDVIANMD